MRTWASLAVVMAATACADGSGTQPQDVPETGGSYRLDTLAVGFDRAVTVQRDAQGAMLVALQTGLVVRPNGDVVHDLRSQVPADLNFVGGLLNFLVAGNRRFAFLTSGDNDHTLIAEVRGNALDTLLLTTDLKTEHHGGGLAWYRDKLLVALGDGGSGTGRGPGLAGKIVAIDVQTRQVEIVASGLRNPWRMALATDSLWIADAGDRRSEEVNVMDLRSPGADFGWGVSEGTTCLVGSCAGVHWPLFSYPTGPDCSTVIGGAWYRGQFWFADYCKRWVSTVGRDGKEERRFALGDNVISLVPVADAGPVIVTAGGMILQVRLSR